MLRSISGSVSEVVMFHFVAFIYDSCVDDLGTRALSHLWFVTFKNKDLITNLGALKLV